MYTEGGGACPGSTQETMRLKPRRDLVFVSAGLGLDGGGRAAAGRLLAGACAAFARERGLSFRLLSLDGTGLPDGEVPVRGFGGNQRALAAAVWKQQLTGRRTAHVFDLLGVARTQSYLPAPLRAPYLLPLYGIEVWRPLEWDRRRALARATAAFAISAHTLERARPFFPRAVALPVVPLALEERRPEGAVDAGVLGRLGRPGRPGGEFLLIAGRMDPRERYKGHDEVLEALKGVEGVRLVVAGDGDDRPRLEQKAAAFGMEDRVTFTGFLSEATLAELYRRCAAFVMPSRGEGFGLVYLEAMRAPRGSAAEEIVVHEKTGLLVDPDQREELREALARLIDHPGEARRMGEAGHERWRREFGVERFRERLEPLLERLAG
jgi:phosphatidylinositol alpha-1,6-mannosyltransferase